MYTRIINIRIKIKPKSLKVMLFPLKNMSLLPIFNKENSSTKDKIISILAANPALNTKKIFNLIKKQYALNVTYQAIHKTLKQLLNEKVLYCENKRYYLDENWIKQLKHFVNKCSQKSNLKDTPIIYNKISDEMETIEAINLSAAEELYFKFREEYFQNISKYPEEERILCNHAPHMYIALMSPAEEYEFMDRLLKHKTKLYCLCKGNTIVDEWIKKFYNSKKGNPYKVKTGANCSSINEVWLYPDKLIEVFFSEKFWKFYNNLYEGIERIGNINYSDIIEKLRTLETEPLKIIVHKNKSLIKLAREETIKEFSLKPEEKSFIVSKPDKHKNSEPMGVRRFHQMEETFKQYGLFYNKFVKELIKQNGEESELFQTYVIDRIGSKVGIRAYLMRKFLELNKLDWQVYSDLIALIELHLASMYCFNSGADQKTTLKFSKKLFFSAKNTLREHIFKIVKKSYGQEILDRFKQIDKECYEGLV